MKEKGDAAVAFSLLLAAGLLLMKVANDLYLDAVVKEAGLAAMNRWG